MTEFVDRLRSRFAHRYEIVRVLGSGGAAVVLLAEDLRHDRQVALKVLRPDVAALLGRERFLREIHIAANLVHPHVLPLHDSGEVDGILYYVLPYMAGETLRERLTQSRRLSIETSLRIAGEVADALEYSHSQGVVHRDIKPGNIFLTGEHAMVGDFGIATALATSDQHPITNVGAGIGTPAYMSPEQIDGIDVGPPTDIYALGCVLFEMLTGEPPFGTGPYGAVVGGHARRKPSDVRDHRSEVPASVAQLVSAMLAKKPGERIESASALRYALQAVSGRPSASARLGRGPVLRRARGAMVLGAVALSAVVVSLWPRGPGQAVDDLSFAVLPIKGLQWTESDRDLAWTLADEIARQLNHWEGVRAVPQVAIAGPIFDLGLGDDMPATVEDGAAVARMLDAGTMVALDMRRRGDSVIVEATPVSVSGGRTTLGSPRRVGGLATDVFGLANSIAQDLVGLTVEGTDLGQLSRLSTDAEAIRRFHIGRRDLQRWRLAEARAAFGDAIERDSTFALAHYYLALTLYWQGEGGSFSLSALGPSILRHVTSASDGATGLSRREQRHIGAFRAFVTRDFARARADYGALLEEDPTDSYAHLLLGSVEFSDDELHPGAGGMVPRADWGRAIRSFSESVGLSPDFSLGYGHLFSVFEKLRSAGCPVFWPPSEGTLLLWERHTVAEVTPFCPVVGATIGWASVDRVSRPDLGDGQALARLERTTEVQLRRWVAYAPDESRPHDELARWTMGRRERLPAGSTALEAQALAAEASQYAGRALELRPDTTVADLVRMSGLLLAAGALERSISLIETAWSRTTPEDLSPAAANPFLAAGMPERALEIMAPRRTGAVVALQRPAGGGFVRLGRSEGPVLRMEVLGAAGVAGPELADLVAAVGEIWSAPEYSDADRELLKAGTLRWVGFALLSDAALRERWLSEADLSLVRDEDDAQAWMAWRELTRDREAARHLWTSAVERLRDARPGPGTLYLYARLAQEFEAHEVAVELFDRVEQYPASVSAFGQAWALHGLSILHRADSRRALGDVAGSTADLTLLSARWTHAEPNVRALLARR